MGFPADISQWVDYLRIDLLDAYATGNLEEVERLNVLLAWATIANSSTGLSGQMAGFPTDTTEWISTLKARLSEAFANRDFAKIESLTQSIALATLTLPGGQSGSVAAPDYKEITQTNNFTAPSVLRQTTNGWVRAKADALANADIWLCIEATPTKFKVANTCKIYSFPGHGLGSANQVLKLSAVTDGLLTTTEPTAGNYRIILGSIFDANSLLWAPSLKAELV